MPSDTSSSAAAPVVGSTPAGRVALLVHGGAWDIPDKAVDDHLDGLRKAVARGRRALERGASALDVVEETVAAMERHGAFDAGRGAVLNRDGGVQLDAGVMCGASLRWGAVAGVHALPEPVRVARRLLDADGQARLLVADGAERWAAEQGFPFVEPSSLIHPREVARFEALRDEAIYHTSEPFAGPRGTVGCVALDAQGCLAAATSTGGTPFAPAGRVGDSPLVGSGFFATDAAAASATGWGEALATVQIAARTCALVDDGLTPSDAVAQQLTRMRERIVWPGAAPASGGVIAMSADGRAGWAFTTPRMARAGWAEGQEPWAAV